MSGISLPSAIQVECHQYNSIGCLGLNYIIGISVTLEDGLHREDIPTPPLPPAPSEI